MTIIRRKSPVNLDVLEHEISSAAHLPMAELVEDSSPLAEDIGKLSADAVLEQYRMAAKSVEEMGDEVQQRVRSLEAALKDCHEDMALLKEAAAAIMEKGKAAQAEVERSSALSKNIREIVATIKSKL